MKKFLFLSLIFMSFFACVDKDYDLDKDISTEMEIFSDKITLPIGYTDKLSLDSLIKDVDYLYIDSKGNYYLSILDSFSSGIDEFDRDNLRIEGQSYPSESSVPSIVSPSGSFILDSISFVFKDTFDIQFSEMISEEILAFKEINFKDDAYITIDMSLENIPASIPKEKIRITFNSQIPDLIKLKDGSNIFNFSDNFNAAGKLTKSTSFSKFEKEIVLNNGVFDFEDIISTEVVLQIKDMEVAPPREDVEALGDMLLGFTVSISDLEIKSIVGKINLLVEPDATPIDLSGFADALGNNSENTFDVAKTDILFTCNKNVDIDLSTSLKLSAMKNGVTTSSESITLSIDDQENKFFISNDISNAPAGYDAHKMDIPKVLKSMPEEIDATLSAQTNTEKYFFFDFYEAYEVKGSYNINIPLAFGKDFRIYMKDTIDFDLDSETLDIFFKKGTVELAGAINSTFPLGIEMKLVAIDSVGNKLDLEKSVTVPNKNFSITLDKSDLISLKKTFLWEVVFEVKVKDAQSNVAISKNDYIELRDLRLRIKDGIVIGNIDELGL
ncbi:hypothetical protein LJC16_02595 [Bacteroidales bacterium OttesenSCG-928-C19]|nr:hypothetical protein [Bacteroidales bacterium OttesenSCG-928-C19]